MTDQPVSPSVDKAAQQKIIGARLREARESIGITQEDASAALGIPRTSIIAMEKGTRGVAATELSAISTLYRRPIKWILNEEESPDVEATALFRATAALSDSDKEQVLKFAQFLATAGSPPKPEQKQ